MLTSGIQGSVADPHALALQNNPYAMAGNAGAGQKGRNALDKMFEFELFGYRFLILSMIEQTDTHFRQ